MARSAACRSDPSLECAGAVVSGTLVAPVGGVVAGFGCDPAAALSFLGRRRAALVRSAAAVALLAVAHRPQLL